MAYTVYSFQIRYINFKFNFNFNLASRTLLQDMMANLIIFGLVCTGLPGHVAVKL